MPEIRNEAKIGCKYLTLADRGLNPAPNGNIKVSKDVYDEVFWGGSTELIQDIPYYLSGTIENDSLILKRNKDNKIIPNGRNPVMKLGKKHEKTIVRKVRNSNQDRNKRIFMFYSISDDNNKPIFVFLEQGSQAWNAAENSGITFAQLDDTVLSPGDNMYKPVKDFINNCFNAVWNRNWANQVWPNCTEEYIKIPIESITGDNPTLALATELLSRLNDNAEERRIVKVNYFGLQYAKAIIDSQILNSAILDKVNEIQNAVDAQGYIKNLENMQTLFKFCEVVRTYENNVIDNNIRTPENNVANNINIREANRNRNIKEPRNLIVFGAPGTGKSYSLNDQTGDFDKIERVTFYPSYSYSQFVGCYKPVMNDENISYSFVPGPFLRTYVDAVNNPSKNYLLIIEEINRADAASVFGDVFQLLDRDKDGNSVYSISASEDIKKYLKEKEISSDKLSIPSNMYIWATMNSADQGVFPMDTAFKRRWDFLYFDLDGNPIEDNANCPVNKDNWDAIRNAINNWLCEKKVNEDKHLGKYFLNIEDNVEEKDFRDAFKNKVLMYLYEDAARAFRSELFEKNSFSAILKKFNESGTDIFKPGSIKCIANGVANEVANGLGNGEERAN